jgi:hypothetical protein
MVFVDSNVLYQISHHQVHENVVLACGRRWDRILLLFFRRFGFTRPSQYFGLTGCPDFPASANNSWISCPKIQSGSRNESAKRICPTRSCDLIRSTYSSFFSYVSVSRCSQREREVYRNRGTTVSSGGTMQECPRLDYKYVGSWP